VRTADGMQSGPPRRAAKSASPRPVPHRPVDTVKLAREEVQLPALPPPPRLAKQPGRVPAASVVHEGFYDFAAAVVKQQPSQRQHALRLTELLEDGLLFRAGGTSEAQPNAKPLALQDEDQGITPVDAPQRSIGPETTHSSILSATHRRYLEDARRLQSMIAFCLEIVEQFGCELTTECRERFALMSKAKAASAEAVEQLLHLIQACHQTLEEHEGGREGLHTNLLQLEEDNSGLRSVVKKMISHEDDFKAQVDVALIELTTQRRSLAEAQDRVQELEAALAETTAELTALRAEREAIEVRDGGNSPMMCFATFCMAPDSSQPPGIVAELADQGEWCASSMQSIGGMVKASLHANHAPRRTAALPGLHSSISHTFQGQLEEPEPEEPQNSRSPRRLSLAPKGTMPLGTESGPLAFSSDALPLLGQESRSAQSAANSHSSSKQPSEYAEDLSVTVQQPAEQASIGLLQSFPALIHFMEISASESSGPPRDAVRVNQEHLEKHLMLLQKDLQEQVDQKKAAQDAVDRCLDRVMVWILAVHNSLQNLSTSIVAQDVAALAELRAAVEWMTKQPLEKWIEAPDSWTEALDGYEKRLRERLEEERQADLEVDELKRALAQQRQRVVELSDQLLEARASLSSSARSVHAPRSHATPSAQGSGAASEGLQALSERGTPVQRQRPHSSRLVRPVGAQQPGTAQRTDSASYAGNHEASPTKESDHAENEPRSRVESTMSDVVAQVACPVLPLASTAASPEALRDELKTSPDSGALAASMELEEQEEETPSAVPRGSSLPASAVETMDMEARKMKLLRSPFVEGIDFTVVSGGALVFLKGPQPEVSTDATATGNDKDSTKDETVLGKKQLRSLISDIYAAKRASDKRCDTGKKPRRALHDVVSEVMKRLHGVRSVVHQKSWQLAKSVLLHAPSDRGVSLFCDFLDGTRDVDELSFMLYCTALLTTVVLDPLGDLTGRTLPEGCVSEDRAIRLMQLLFEELPKACDVLKAEMQKLLIREVAKGTSAKCDCLSIDELLELMLEGWRTSKLLMEQEVAGFSWRQCALAFMQADARPNGCLDPHELQDAQARLNGAQAWPSRPGVLPASTSLGAFVLSEIQRRAQQGETTTGEQQVQGASLKREKTQRKQLKQACVEVSKGVFRSLESTLGVYLTWLMHSEELRDLSLYRSLKAQIFGFHQATGVEHACKGAHHLRCLLLLLLAHQFDTQVQKDEIAPEHLEWEAKCLLSILQEGWRWQGRPVPEDVLSCQQQATSQMSSEGPATFITA